MTKEELLKPRWKVIADYPKSPFTTGDVLHPMRGNVAETYGKNYCLIRCKEFDAYPHLFKKLHWSEEREISDLPKYVKIDFGGGSWRGKIGKAEFSSLNTNVEVFFSDTDSKRFHRFDTIPATESEYNDYKKSLKNK